MDHAYRDRHHAGRKLARALADLPDLDGPAIVLALPRGGVPVGYEVAQELDAPLDLMIVRKLGFPGHEEMAMGAIATGGTQVIDDQLVRQSGITRQQLDQKINAERRELHRREQRYRGNRPEPQLADRSVILVDDGLATGSTMLSAAMAATERAPHTLTIAVPVAPPDTCARFENIADHVVCPLTPPGFRSVSQWYQSFEQTTDDEVRDLLERAWRREANGA